MANYNYEECAITPIRDIVKHAAETSQNDNDGLGFSFLGRIVHDLWGEKIIRAKRGSSTERHYVYLNLKWPRIEPLDNKFNQEENELNLSPSLSEEF